MNVELAGNMAIVSENGFQTTVALLPGRIFLFNEKVSQVFRVPARLLFLDKLPSWFATPIAVEEAADHFREGHTNKDRFLESARKLMRQRKITEADFARLRAFITKCDCAPSMIRRKLVPLGYAALPLEFEDKDPRLEATVDILWRLTEHFRSTEERPVEQKEVVQADRR